jgi:hypothetical protein
MKIISYRYSVINCDIVQLDPNEIITFPQVAASASYGFFGLGGYTTMINGVVIGRKFESEGQWAPNNSELGWSNDIIGHDNITIKAGSNGSKWLCLTNNGSYNKLINQQSIIDNYNLPAGSGFIVASGTVNADGHTINQFGYFRPRTAQLLVTGTAELLILTAP